MKPLRRYYGIASRLSILVGSCLMAGCALKVVDVGAPAVNCVFDPSCTVTVTDSTATIPLPAGGTNFLQSRTFVGQPGAPANGLYAYEYRIDLRNALGLTYIPCLNAMTLEFGPVVDSLDYNGDAVTGDQVYVVTSGGLGSIGLASATKSGNSITFNFSAPVCAGGAPGTGDSTYFFGLVSNQPHRPVTATVKETIGPVYEVPARAPQL